MAGERLEPNNRFNKDGEEYYLVSTEINKDVIHKHIVETGAKISNDYKGKDLVMVGVLKGSFMFLADLMRETHIEDGTLQVDFVGVSSYDDKIESSGKPKIIKDIDANVEGKDVLIVEDIIDSGFSLEALLEFFRIKGASSVEVSVLFTKPSRREVEVPVKYDGIEVEDFIVGIGLDYQQLFRELPDLAAIRFV